MLRMACLIGMLAAIGLLAGCQPHDAMPTELTDITDHMADLSFQLTDDQGKPASAANFRGKITLLYFGYTHCPDVCPLTLAHLHVAMQKLGPLAEGVRVLFVSVDPQRDTPATLHEYVSAFDPRVVGLTGTPSAIEALTKRYRAAFTREPGKSASDYDVSHSSAVYIFDRSGKARLLDTPADSQDKLVHDLRLLLDAKVSP